MCKLQISYFMADCTINLIQFWGFFFLDLREKNPKKYFQSIGNVKCKKKDLILHKSNFFIDSPCVPFLLTHPVYSF